MRNHPYLLGLSLALAFAGFVGLARAQYPVVDTVGNRVVQKYQQSTCEQLWQERAHKQPPTQAEDRAVQMLRTDAQMRAAFVTIVAAPVVDKMIVCGMIP
jgi:hypothetical protein